MSRDAFYRALEGTHNLYFSELRFGQFIDNFFGYIKRATEYDLYYLTDSELLNLLEKYVLSEHRKYDEITT